MSTLLILGSKPDPALPPKSSYEHLACANASGFSAARHGLPDPTYTVMSAILTSGIASGKQSMQVLTGLQTDVLYFFPRPAIGGHFLKRTKHIIKTFRMQPFYLKWKLRSLSYEYKHFVNFNLHYYHNLAKELCDHDERIMKQIESKQPSTGVMAVLIGMAQQKYQRYILSGFSFELTHAYAENPEIDERGTKVSKHANTDMAVIGYLSEKYGNIYTTEIVVNERTGIPMLEESDR